MKKTLLLLILAFPVLTLAAWVVIGLNKKNTPVSDGAPAPTNSIRIESIGTNQTGK